MILFYALGGGLGHLSRCLAVIHSLKLENEEYKVLTASPRAEEIFAPHQLLTPPSAADKSSLRTKFEEIIKHYNCDEVYVDAFPAGILGELEGWRGSKVHLIARHLKWEVYQQRLDGPIPQFDTVFACEQIAAEQKAALHFKHWKEIELQWPASEVNWQPPANCWLVVHAGEEDEVRALYRQALDLANLEALHPAICIIGNPELDPAAFPLASLLSEYPAWPLFPQVDRIFTGGGFNSVHQLKNYRDKQVMLPFDRKLDDQALRIRRAFSEC